MLCIFVGDDGKTWWLVVWKRGPFVVFSDMFPNGDLRGKRRIDSQEQATEEHLKLEFFDDTFTCKDT